MEINAFIIINSTVLLYCNNVQNTNQADSKNTTSRGIYRNVLKAASHLVAKLPNYRASSSWKR